MEVALLARDTVHNPAEQRHFMKLKPAMGRVRVLHKGRLLADTARSVGLIEIGKEFYDPILSLPETDRIGCFSTSAVVSNCPLNGDASYFDFMDENGNVIIREIGWCYPSPYTFVSGLAGLVAFYSRYVTIEESPA